MILVPVILILVGVAALFIGTRKTRHYDIPSWALVKAERERLKRNGRY